MPQITPRGAGALLQVEVLGEVQVSSFLMGMRYRIKDMRSIWEKIDDILRASSKTIFRQEGRPAWQALKESTARQRARLGYGAYHPILRRTDRLRDSVIERHHPEHIFVARPREMEFGTTVPYAIYPQQNPDIFARDTGIIPSGKLPRRAYIYMDKKDFAKIVGAIRKYVLQKEKGEIT